MTILAQIFGGLALLIMVIGMQFRKKKNMLLAQIMTNTCYIIQYILLGAFTGVFTFIVNNLRSSTFYFYTQNCKKPSIWLLFLFSGLSIIIGIITYKNLFSIIPVVSSIISTYGAWQKKAKIFRIAIMTSSLILIFHDFHFRAYTGMISYTLTVTSTLIGFLKYDVFRKEKEEAKQDT